MSDKDRVLQDLLDRASSRKFDARHGHVPVESLGEEAPDDYPSGWLDAKVWAEEDYWVDLEGEYQSAMADCAPTLAELMGTWLSLSCLSGGAVNLFKRRTLPYRYESGGAHEGVREFTGG